MSNKLLKLLATQRVFVTLDDSHMYEFDKNDLSMIKVDTFPSDRTNILILHTLQFDHAKAFLLNADNPFRIDVDTAELYHQIGFINSEELVKFKVAESELPRFVSDPSRSDRSERILYLP